MFWDYSIDEISDLIKQYQRRKKEKIILNNVLANTIIEGIAFLFGENQDRKPSMLWDYFPDLFAEEKKIFEIKQEQEQFEKFKEKRRNYAAMHNKRIGGE